MRKTPWLLVMIAADHIPLANQSPLVYCPMVESSVGIVGACLPLLRPLFTSGKSRGFMRTLQSVRFPMTAGSATLQGTTLQNTAVRSPHLGDWNSTISTPMMGAAGFASGEPCVNKDKPLPSLPASDLRRSEYKMPTLPPSSLRTLEYATIENPWRRQPKQPV